MELVTNQSPIVQVDRLTYRYAGEKVPVLKNINLQIPRGAFYSLIGPSGGGKSTLLLLVRGFYQEIGGELSGSIKVFGRDVSRTSISELGRTIGIVFQNPALQLHQLRVLDEVASAPMYKGLPWKDCVTKAKDLIDRLLGKDFYYRSPSELSAGQQQRVAVAASLALEPEILLLDEPFSFLDSSAKEELLQLLVDLHQAGKTIVVTTHDVDLISKVSTHMGLIKRGELAADSSPRTVLYSKILSTTMPPPLFVQAAKTARLPWKPVSWERLLLRLTVRAKDGQEPKRKETEAGIALKGVTYHYPDSNHGVTDITLEALKGEIVGLIGANGSGKTTVAKIVMGLLKPTKGKVIYNHQDITNTPVEQRARFIGYSTQDPLDMFFESNLWDEVAAGPHFLGLPDPKHLAEQSLKQYGLWQYRSKHPDSISGGEKSRLGLADVTVKSPSILLLDEPEFGLDPKNWEEITSFLIKLKNQGATMIVITQDLEAALFLCDRIALMDNGRVVEIESAPKILRDNKLLQKAGLRPLVFSPLLGQFDKRLDRNSFLSSLFSKPS